jgi:hypothetical protein
MNPLVVFGAVLVVAGAFGGYFGPLPLYHNHEDSVRRICGICIFCGITIWWLLPLIP